MQSYILGMFRDKIKKNEQIILEHVFRGGGADKNWLPLLSLSLSVLQLWLLQL